MKLSAVFLIIMLLPAAAFADGGDYPGSWQGNFQGMDLPDIGWIDISEAGEKGRLIAEIGQPGFAVNMETEEAFIGYMDAGTVVLDPLYEDDSRDRVVAYIGTIPAEDKAEWSGNSSMGALTLTVYNFTRTIILTLSGETLTAESYNICWGLDEYNNKTVSTLYRN